MNPSDAIALLRSAVKTGLVIVVIERERVTMNFRNDVGTSQPTHPRPRIDRSRKSIAAMLANGTRPSATRNNADFISTTRSWRQNYDDVSADDLIKYIKSVIAGIPGDTANVAETADGVTDQPTHRGNAGPFDLGADFTPGALINVAARGVSDADEAECLQRYELDMEQCQVARAIYNDPRTYAACSARAFANYQSCRGY